MAVGKVEDGVAVTVRVAVGPAAASRKSACARCAVVGDQATTAASGSPVSAGSVGKAKAAAKLPSSLTTALVKAA